MAAEQQQQHVQQSQQSHAQGHGPRLAHVQISSHEGPLPPPDTLRAFDDIVPGAAERIIAMAERQSAHRISMESQALGARIGEGKRGQVCAFLISLLGLGGFIYLAATGHHWSGLAALVVSAGTVTAAFLGARQAKK